MFRFLFIIFIMIPIASHAQTAPNPGDSCAGSSSYVFRDVPQSAGNIRTMLCINDVWKLSSIITPDGGHQIYGDNHTFRLIQGNGARIFDLSGAGMYTNTTFAVSSATVQAVDFWVGSGSPSRPTSVIKTRVSQTGAAFEIRTPSSNVGDIFHVSPDTMVGIGTSSPQATLDIDGYIKLISNSSAPEICDNSQAGAIALTSSYEMCICDGTNWQKVNTSTACSW